MADLKISQLGPFSQTDVVASDVLALADISAEQTKKISASNLVKAGARLNADTITFGNNVVITGDLTVNGTETIINTETLEVEDKNVVLGNVTTPTDVTADGGGITLKGATDKTFNWVNATDAWTSSENLDLASNKGIYLNGFSVIASSSSYSFRTGAEAFFYDNTETYTVSFKAPTTFAASVSWTLPGTDGTSGQALTTDGSGNLAWATPSGTGVSSVTGTAPVTSSGGTTPDIALALKTNGGLVVESNELAVDLSASSVTGTLATSDGGTGQTTYANGELLIGKTDGTLAKATITQGSGVTITNGDGTITIAATGSGGTVTSVDVSGGVGLTSSGGPITSNGTITVDLDNTAVTPGSYTYASITVDQQGRLTAASNGTAPLTSSDIGVTVQGYDADTAKLDVIQTFTAVQTLTDPAIIGTILEDVYTISDGAAFEVDPGNGSVQLITLGANRTPKATNFAAGESVTLMVNDGTSYTLTWSDSTWGTSGVVWTGGIAPTLAGTGYTVIQFWKVGTQVYGALVGEVA